MLWRRVLCRLILVIAILWGVHKVAGWWTQVWWFDEVSRGSGHDYQRVYRSIMLWRCGLFAGGALLFAGPLLFSLRRAHQVARLNGIPLASNAALTANAAPTTAGSLIPPEDKRKLDRFQPWLQTGIVGAFVFLAGSYASLHWMQIARVFHVTPLQQPDPVFGHDLSFYLFQLPALQLLWGFVFTGLCCALLLVVGLYVYEDVLELGDRRARLSPSGLQHLAQLLAALLAWRAVGYGLDRYALLFRARAAFTGIDNADLQWRLPVLYGLALLALAAAGASLWWARREDTRGTLKPVGIYLLASLLLNVVVPLALQPLLASRGNRTGHFAQWHQQATHPAYGIKNIRTLPSGSTAQSLDKSTSDGATVGFPVPRSDALENLPVWPAAALQQWLQENTPAGFVYTPLTLDRYTIEGIERPVWVAVREVAPGHRDGAAAFTSASDTAWFVCDAQRVTPQNTPLIYRGHPQGLSSPDENFRISRPVIYGLNAFNPVAFTPPNGGLADGAPSSFFGRPNTGLWPRRGFQTGTPSEDYWLMPNEKATAVDQISGLHAGWWQRALLALRFGDLQLVFASRLAAEQRIIWHRSVVERCRQLAPFLLWPNDAAHPVRAGNGRLLWMLHGYALSSTYPYAQPLTNTNINALRSGVTAVVDAHDGSARFFITDTSDPHTALYHRMFPGLLQPWPSMPPDLRVHNRYPTLQLLAQAEAWRHHTGMADRRPGDILAPVGAQPALFVADSSGQKYFGAVALFFAPAPNTRNPADQPFSAALFTTRDAATATRLWAWRTHQPRAVSQLLLPAEKSAPRSWAELVESRRLLSPLFVTLHSNELWTRQTRLAPMTGGRVPALAQQQIARLTATGLWRGAGAALLEPVAQNVIARNTPTASPRRVPPAATATPATASTPRQASQATLQLQQVRRHWRAMQRARKRGDWKTYDLETRRLDKVLSGTGSPRATPTGTPAASAR